MPLKNPHNQDGPTSEPQPVAIYTRVSTDNQVGGRFDSCESQAAYCREKIEQSKGNGWHEVACLTDAAYSGATMDRPGMRALKRMVEAGEVKIVLVYKLERVLRSTDEWVPFRGFLKAHGCRLESATEDLSERTPSGRLKNNLMMSFSQYERENTAEKTRAKMRQQAKRGYWNGGIIPYGYSYDKNTQALQPNPEEAAIVRRIFEQAAKLVSLTDVANELNAAGLRTRVRTLQRRDGRAENIGGGPFRSDGLRLLIRNPLYRGAVKFEGQEFAAKHESLVKADVWEKANAATAETKVRPQHLFQDRDAQNHLLKGLAWCGSCGRALVPNDSGKKSLSGVKYRYYTCSLIMRQPAAPGCAVGRLSADALEKAVVALLGEASKHPVVIKEMVETSRKMRRGDRESLRTELETNKGALATVDRQLNNCVDAVAQGGTDALGDALVKRATELRNERRRLLLQQERIRQALAASDATALEERRISENLERMGELLPKLSPAERKELIRLFVERVDVRRLVPSGRRKASESVEQSLSPTARLMEVRIKLHLPELVRGMEARAGITGSNQNIRLRGLSLDGRVDFSNAQRGEVAIIAPFQRTVRLDKRMRTVRTAKPKVEHPVLRAQKWQQMLQSGEVGTRMALAKRVRLTPSAITRIMKLIELAPDIQAYLASLTTANAVWHFGYKPIGKLAELPFNQQRAAFAKLRAEYEQQQQTNRARQNIVALTASTKPSGGPSFRASAG